MPDIYKHFTVKTDGKTIHLTLVVNKYNRDELRNLILELTLLLHRIDNPDLYTTT